MHEIVHTLPNCWNHKEKFIFWRNQILNIYPCIDIMEDKKEFNYAFENLKQPKHIIKCNCCGKEFKLYKKLKKSLNDYFCSKCESDDLCYIM